MNPNIILQIFLPCKATGSWQVYVFLKSFILPFRNSKSRILNMFWFICYFLLILLDSQSLITCPISAKEEPVFFFFLFSSCFVPRFTWFCLSWVVSTIWAVVIWRQNLSFFFTWFCLSWVFSPIWTVVIWRQNLSFFFFFFFFFFQSGSVSLGELVHFRLCVFIL